MVTHNLATRRTVVLDAAAERNNRGNLSTKAFASGHLPANATKRQLHTPALLK